MDTSKLGGLEIAPVKRKGWHRYDLVYFYRKTTLVKRGKQSRMPEPAIRPTIRRGRSYVYIHVSSETRAITEDNLENALLVPPTTSVTRVELPRGAIAVLGDGRKFSTGDLSTGMPVWTELH